jgi:hypothetical protein
MKNKSTDKILGAFAQSLEKYYNSWGNLIGRSFVSGLFTALGATVGLALILAFFGVVLGWLGVLPVVGDFFVRIDQVLKAALTTK